MTSSTHKRTSFESSAMNNRGAGSSGVSSGFVRFLVDWGWSGGFVNGILVCMNRRLLANWADMVLILCGSANTQIGAIMSSANAAGVHPQIKDSKPNPEHKRHSTNAVSTSRVRELCNKIVINSFSDDDCHKAKLKRDEKDCPQVKTEHPTFNNSLKLWTHWPIGWLCVCLERKTVPIGVESESFFLWREEQLTSALVD